MLTKLYINVSSQHLESIAFNLANIISYILHTHNAKKSMLHAVKIICTLTPEMKMISSMKRDIINLHEKIALIS